MYGNAYIDPNDTRNKLTENEDPVKLAQFEARIAPGEKIEPADWMPAEYRKQLILNDRATCSFRNHWCTS